MLFKVCPCIRKTSVAIVYVYMLYHHFAVPTTIVEYIIYFNFHSPARRSGVVRKRYGTVRSCLTAKAVY